MLYHSEFADAECSFTGSIRKVYFYYKDTNGEPPISPKSLSDVKDAFGGSIEKIENRAKVTSVSIGDKQKVEEMIQSIVSLKSKREAKLKEKQEEEAAKKAEKCKKKGVGLTCQSKDNGTGQLLKSPDCRIPVEGGTGTLVTNESQKEVVDKLNVLCSSDESKGLEYLSQLIHNGEFGSPVRDTMSQSTE